MNDSPSRIVDLGAAMIAEMEGEPTAITAAEMKVDYDWQQAWGFGDSTGYHAVGSYAERCEGARCGDDPVGVANVAEVIAASEGENDASSWVAIARLDDGRFAFVDAGCDYTGWDCQAWGVVWVSDSIENLWRFGVTEDARGRLDGQLVEWKATQ